MKGKGTGQQRLQPLCPEASIRRNRSMLSLARLPVPVNGSQGCSPLSRIESLFYRFLADGFRPGLPACIGAATWTIDREISRHLVCECGHAGMIARPFYRGTKGYRILAVCPACSNFAEEV
jgi:hypothetical protein